MRITKLSAQKKKKFVNLFLDGKYHFSLSLDLVLKNGLFKGKNLSEIEVEKLFLDSYQEKLTSKALNFLSFRPRSKKEINDYLDKKLYPLQSIELKIKTKLKKRIIKKLEKIDLIDDSKFASWWVGQRLQFRPKGKAILRAELFKKGVEGKIVDQALTKISLKDSFSMARKVVSKKKRLFKGMEEKKLRQKLIDSLLRRGFEFELVKKVIDAETEK
ncbi:hypothetical protein COT75_01440 [Candidatus Beckwithbacteria bacterium CG10_big_fil_rev_8_21_14_0_10_34_10]|uniref:Regulatory protein RecX n=1 Tax=Candidatus Beckwithbacteria bacterium CG10_big_fil_rev_8_21_14_0_10_34_10 TaxID=1974495 RepID=A0A2H0W9V2_9BACT|nr:MAG: hypothetical protein COT75_01440 [Candidatus Beckwithbacteria bacterium CG10_big_fil_rev_8_21_14_0_10_34_10]